jgi:hypothetical protein
MNFESNTKASSGGRNYRILTLGKIDFEVYGKKGEGGIRVRAFRQHESKV